MTHTWRLFGNSVRAVVRLIQKTIRQKLGWYTTVGIGDNPVQAKLALDLYAKHNHELIGEIHYETVPDKIWSINELTDVWGIGPRMAKRLNRLQIHNMYELAHTNPYLLKQQLGVIGSQLFATAWGIDRAQVTEPTTVKEASLGNSRVLPRDYFNQAEIETVIKEIGEQVAARLRHHHKLAGCLSLRIGFSYAAAEADGRGGFNQALKIEPTNDNQVLTQQLLWLFRQNWDGQAVRNIGVYSSKLSANSGQQLNLFETPRNQMRRSRLNRVFGIYSGITFLIV